jgi:hypothetical protein
VEAAPRAPGDRAAAGTGVVCVVAGVVTAGAFTAGGVAGPEAGIVGDDEPDADAVGVGLVAAP